MSLTWCLQALLARHEAFVEDVERDQLQTSKVVGMLEDDKRRLSEENAQAIDENRALLSQLEELNRSLVDSDAQVKSLSATLRSAELEVQRLATLASRTTRLEAQLEALELEHTEMHQTVILTKEQERNATQHWKRAERALAALQDDIERIEEEAEVERKRNAEIIGRLERKRLVESELEDGFEEREKIGTKTGENHSQAGGSVISRFVSDILQDNANLQSGIVELRERLLDSEEHTDRLREQLDIVQQNAILSTGDDSQGTSLAKDMRPMSPYRTMHELHVHHHIHEAGRAKEKPMTRRLVKRGTATVGITTATSLQDRHLRLRQPTRAQSERSTAAAAILSRTSVSVPIAPPPMSSSHATMQIIQSQSDAMSPASSSPASSKRRVHIFEHTSGESVLDTSRPTSPDSIETLSPAAASSRAKGKSQDGSISQFLPPKSREVGRAARKAGEQLMSAMLEDHESWGSEQKSTHNTAHIRNIDAELSQKTTENIHEQSNLEGSRLRRTASHDTLLSVSGMDIHTLRHRPSQLVVTGHGLYPQTGLGSSSLSAALTSNKPVLGAMSPATRPSIALPRQSSNAYGHAFLQRGPQSSLAKANLSAVNIENKGKYGKRLGDWVWAKLGTGNSPLPSQLKTDHPVSKGAAAQKDRITQAVRQEPHASTVPEVVSSEVDQVMLQECLMDG